MTNGERYSDGSYVFQDRRVATDNSDNGWQESQRKLEMAYINRKMIGCYVYLTSYKW